jgi:histidine triad (HIT) family protein
VLETQSLLRTLIFYHMEETIFSKIIKRELPADIVYENEYVVAFLDISPINPGGTLVVPKKWSRNILDIDRESWAHVMEAVRILAPAVKEAMHAKGLNIIMNNEPVGNQIIFHSHVHIIPRHEGDKGIDTHGTPYREGEQARVAEAIRARISKS